MSTGSSEESSGSSEVMSPPALSSTSEAVFSWPNYSVCNVLAKSQNSSLTTIRQDFKAYLNDNFFAVLFALGLSINTLTMFAMVLAIVLLVDDAFVVVGVLDNLTRKEYSYTIEQTFGKVMKRAGVSISITSLTSIVSFAVCGITVIPGISSFCICCSIGLVAIYALTISFFFATLVLKAKHVDESRDGCFMWIRREKEKPTEAESGARVSMGFLFRAYTQILLKTPCMVLVIVVALLLMEQSRPREVTNGKPSD